MTLNIAKILEERKVFVSRSEFKICDDNSFFAFFSLYFLLFAHYIIALIDNFFPGISGPYKIEKLYFCSVTFSRAKSMLIVLPRQSVAFSCN